MQDRWKRWLDRLRDPFTLTRGATLTILAVGLTITLSVLISPTWPLELALELFPEALVRLTGLFGIEVETLILGAGAGLSLVAMGSFLVSEYQAGWREGHPPQLREKRLIAFIAMLSFIVGFVGARAVVVLGGLAESAAPAGQGGTNIPLPFGELWIQGYHIHHFFYGFLLLVAAGWVGLFHPGVSRRVVAVLYGLGIGIFVDEWGLLVTMGDYGARSSWFVAITFLSLLSAGLIWTFGQAEDPEREAG